NRRRAPADRGPRPGRLGDGRFPAGGAIPSLVDQADRRASRASRPLRHEYRRGAPASIRRLSLGSSGRRIGARGGREATMGKLQDKVAIVTGATIGMGRAIAERFAAEGAAII